jgi:3-oxoacyl-[acyl-carrier protein] reductase
VDQSEIPPKVALVSGSNRGIGLAIVKRLAADGFSVLAGVRQPDGAASALLRDVATESSGGVRVVKVDLSDADVAAKSAKEIVQEFPRIDVLVNNAGVAAGGLFQMTSMPTLRDVFEVNFFATMAFTQVVVRRMMRLDDSAIVNVASTAAINGDSGTFAYGASKAALIYATSVMARELGAHGIRVNAVAPTVTDTEMASEMDSDSRERLINGGIIKRAATPAEIADVVSFLAGPNSSMIVGQVIKIDGGQRGR